MAAKNDFTEIVLSYGSETRTVRAPARNLLQARRGAGASAVNVAEELRRKLDAIPGSTAWPGGKRPDRFSVTIVADDYTRPTPAHLILPELLNWLNAQGISDGQIRLLVAAGFHREMTPQELEKKYGAETLKRVPVHHHDALDYEKMTNLGELPGGHPVWVNSLAVGADLTIGVGLVEIHPWAGFAGGAKIVSPGVAGKKTINWTHALPVRPGVEIGKVKGNPFWESCLEVARAAGLNFVINAVLDPQEEVIGIFAGPADQAQLEGIELFKRVNGVRFPERADIVLTSSNPKYQYWGQAIIAGYNAARVVKNGGIRIILGACPEGFGDSQEEIIFYYDALHQKWDDPMTFWNQRLGEDAIHSRNTCAVLRHLQLLEMSDLYLVTDGLPPATPHMESLTVFADAQEALDTALERLGPDATIAAYDMGGMVLPMVDGE